MLITWTVDGVRGELEVEPRVTVLDALRERLGVWAPKKGCDHGQCGACTVLLDGRRVLSCLSLSVAQDGAEIVTAAGLAAVAPGRSAAAGPAPGPGGAAEPDTSAVPDARTGPATWKGPDTAAAPGARAVPLHPVARAFLEHDGFQCGYCTPGQVCSAVGMLDEARRGWPSHATADVAGEPELTDAEIRERMSGNLCRCGAYPNIVAAIREAAR